MKKLILIIALMCLAASVRAATYYDSSVISVLELENNITDIYGNTGWTSSNMIYSNTVYKYGSYSAGLKNNNSMNFKLNVDSNTWKTVEFYAYYSVTSATNMYMSSSPEMFIMPNTTNLRVYANGGNVTITPMTQNAWHHLAYTFDGTNVKAYLDNSLIGTRSAAGLTYTAIWLFNRTALVQPFGGYMDRVVISNIVKTSFPSLPEHTATPSITMTVTPTITQTVTQTITPTITKTVTQTVTKTVTATVTPTITPTATPTNTPWPDYILNLPVIKDPWYRGPWFPWLDKNPRTPRNRK